MGIVFNISVLEIVSAFVYLVLIRTNTLLPAHTLHLMYIDSTKGPPVLSIGPFRHSDISVKAVNQHGGRVLIYIV